MNMLWQRFVKTMLTCCVMTGAPIAIMAIMAIIAMPAVTVCAADKALPPALSRQDRLLLLDNVARLWQSGIAGIGSEEQHSSGDDPFDRIGRIHQDQLDPQFILAQSLVLMIHFGADGQIARLAPDEIWPAQAKEQEELFRDIPGRFTRYYPYAALEQAALSYLGWPLGQFTPPEGVLQTEKGLYVDVDWWYGPDGPMAAVRRDAAFATALTDYPDSDGWAMEGQVRLVAPGDDGILRVASSAKFHLRARNTGANWRIHDLVFVPQQAN